MDRRHPSAQWGRLFANRNFALLFSGQVVSSMGDLVYDLALMWFVFGATGSALKTGGVMIAGMVAQILFGLPAGALVDRWNRKVIMIVSDVVRGSIVFVAALLAGSGHLPLGYVYAASFCLHMSSMLFGPARNAVMPDVVGAELTMSANVGSGMAGQLVAILGTAAGGVMIVFLGAPLAMFLDALSFFFSAVMIALAAIPDTRQLLKARALSGRALLQDIGEGLSFMRQQTALQFVMLIVLLVNFGSSMYAVLSPVFAQMVLKAGPAGFGMIQTAMVIGSLVGGLLVGPVVARLAPNVSITIGLTGAGMAAVALSRVHSLPIALGLFTIMGLSLVFNQAPLFTMLQTRTPGHMRGRVFNAFGMLANLTGPLAISVGALLADRYSPSAVYGLGGGVVLCGALLAVIRPDVLKLSTAQRQEVPHEAQHPAAQTGS